MVGGGDDEAPPPPPHALRHNDEVTIDTSRWRIFVLICSPAAREVRRSSDRAGMSVFQTDTKNAADSRHEARKRLTPSIAGR